MVKEYGGRAKTGIGNFASSIVFGMWVRKAGTIVGTAQT